MVNNSDDKLRINIFGLPAVGKSTLRNALIEKLGGENCGKIPGDHYLKSKFADDSFFKYFTRDNYDWELIEKIMVRPLGEIVDTPLFDYDKFMRINENGSEKKFIVQQMNILDSTYPCPFADLRILITLNEKERKRRVAERGRIDYFWKRYILENWDDVESSDRKNAKNHQKMADLVLNGLGSIESNTKKVIDFIKTHFPNA